MNNYTTPNITEEILLTPGFRPLAGRCVIRVDTIQTKLGRIFVPEANQYLRVDQQNQNKAYTGVVLHMTPRKGKDGKPQVEGFKIGDHVLVMLAMDDLDRPVLITFNTRVYAIHDCQALTGQIPECTCDGSRDQEIEYATCPEVEWTNRQPVVTGAECKWRPV